MQRAQKTQAHQGVLNYNNINKYMERNVCHLGAKGWDYGGKLVVNGRWGRETCDCPKSGRAGGAGESGRPFTIDYGLTSDANWLE